VAEKKPPAKEYSYAVLAVHPTHKKPMPVAVHPTEEAATKDAIARNQKASHLAHHVKKVAKGGSNG
jgi:hypothetical protein